MLLCYKRKERCRTVSAVVIYSMEDDSWFVLPPIAAILGVDKCARRCVGLDGKVYLLEVQNRKPGGILDSYVFDLAG